jgi:hypothetical protein
MRCRTQWGHTPCLGRGGWGKVGEAPCWRGWGVGSGGERNAPTTIKMLTAVLRAVVVVNKLIGARDAAHNRATRQDLLLHCQLSGLQLAIGCQLQSTHHGIRKIQQCVTLHSIVGSSVANLPFPVSCSQHSMRHQQNDLVFWGGGG